MTAAQSLARDVAAMVVAAFENYNDCFREVTQRARGRFERCEWADVHQDAVERIELYERSVTAVAADVSTLLGGRLHDKRLWVSIKQVFAGIIDPLPDNEFYKTFYSSLTRRTFSTIGVDPAIEFIAPDVRPTTDYQGRVRLKRYQNRGALRYLIDELLGDFSFKTRYRNIERTVNYVSAEVTAFCEANKSDIESIEVLEPVFFRGTRAYIVGRIDGDNWVSPLVIALKCTDEGVYVDAIILSENDVSMLFGFTRSYFHVDLELVGATVAFLKSIMPRKPIAEIYTILGRAKQGKTERFRHFFNHLENSSDKFTHAKGDKGMVMEVFTLPSYDVVFKLIRDKFAYPKNMSRAEVKQKYKLVFNHDRAGRLVDAQEFRRLEFDQDRFEPELLDALLSGCSMICRLEHGRVVIDHLYIERRLTPLNLYLKSCSASEARYATIDYGQAIRDLANSNIFAGDLLLKNFGVTRHGRVIFYDYDELCLVTECNFRHLPKPADEIDEMRSGAWYYVGPNDIFPEQFIQFLGFSEEGTRVFLEHHQELLDADYWKSLKEQLQAGNFREVIPYSPKSWSEHIKQGVYVSRQR